MEMTHYFEGTTLALQHYYDISAISRRLPLLTVYQAREQPFGRQMAVWMAAYGDDIPVSEKTHRQLDDILLQNRAVTNPHVLRVLDYGTSEGHSFVVTDALDAGTVRLVGTDYGKIVAEVSALLDDRCHYEKMSHAVNPYGDGKACPRIVEKLK